ncbi:helix-turn-helix transcriptional regulator [bacterium AH-315-J21]|nr:helix-turn-helix transcriptional regulator [bacterium AH-315-J21]
MGKKKYNSDCIAFGLRIKELRLERDWSQEKLADEADMDRSYVGDIERGARNVSLINICKLARTLEVSGKDLLVFIK